MLSLSDIAINYTTSGYNVSALIAIASSYQLYGLRLTYLVGEAITQPG
jgi:hypothetical protein